MSSTEREPIKLPKFKDQKLWELALTHGSYTNENQSESENNQRLEFLGDAVLGFLIAKLLYKRYPQMREGQLSALRAALVNNQHQLAEIAVQLEIDKLVRFGKGAEQEGARRNPKKLSDTLEAIIGAYYLDSGIEAVGEFVETLFVPIADRLAANQKHLNLNVKGRLQEWALANVGENPRYFIIAESGQDHAKEFTAEVRVQGKVYGVGKGHSKKIAEKRAAETALEHLHDLETEKLRS